MESSRTCDRTVDAVGPTGRAVLGGIWGAVDADGHGFTWQRSVGSGHHIVQIQWYSLGGCNHAYVGARSLFVTANVH